MSILETYKDQGPILIYNECAQRFCENRYNDKLLLIFTFAAHTLISVSAKVCPMHFRGPYPKGM